MDLEGVRMSQFFISVQCRLLRSAGGFAVHLAKVKLLDLAGVRILQFCISFQFRRLGVTRKLCVAVFVLSKDQSIS